MSSDHQSLYKTPAFDGTESAARRRRRLLDEQRAQRQHTVDTERQRVQQILDDLLQTDNAGTADTALVNDIDEDLSTTEATDNTSTTQQRSVKSTQRNRHHRNGATTAGVRFKNHLQLSEWLCLRPDDLATSWTMVVCPQGRRCLVVATAGRTSVYAKGGGFVRSFRSALPGDRSGTHADLSMLDCVQTADDGMWVLDVLAWGQHDFTDCDAAFRFHWLANQCADAIAGADDSAAAVNRLRPASRAECSNDDEIAELLQRGPVHGPPVDGLLFYHLESSYVHGSTPLVGWLYPFMVAEVLGTDGTGGECWRSVRPEWMAQRPANYVDAAAYIVEFEAAMKKRRRRGGGRARQQRRAMDVDVQQADDEVDETEQMDELDAERCLEQTGVGIDDVYYCV